MLKERKLDYRTRKIARLEEELKLANETAIVLRNENKVLQTRLDSAERALEQTEAAFQDYVRKYRQCLTDAVDARKTYEALSKECVEIKADYTRQMEKLINDMHRYSK